MENVDLERVPTYEVQDWELEVVNPVRELCLLQQGAKA